MAFVESGHPEYDIKGRDLKGLVSCCQQLSIPQPILTVMSTQKGVDESAVDGSSDGSVRLHVQEDSTNPEKRRQIGLVSAIFIIFNRIIGTGYVYERSVDHYLGSRALPVYSRHQARFWDPVEALDCPSSCGSLVLSSQLLG